MIKKNKWKLLVSSLIILLPVLTGLIFWDSLPDQIATHWGINGTADRWSGRFFAVFTLPLFMLVVHWLCVFFTMRDPGNKNQNRKAFGLIFWICPLGSLYAGAVMYATAFGMEISINMLTLIALGLMFVVIGNYLPKCRHNYTLGIKVKWTLESEENWNVTHRMAGRLWVAGGLLLMACAFLPGGMIPYVLFVCFSIAVGVPVLYSYIYYRKQLKDGLAGTGDAYGQRKWSKISAGIIVLILIVVGVLLFTGNVEIEYGTDSFTIEASYWYDLTVDYDAIETIEYRDQDDPGTRTNGFGSFRLSIGAFRNEEFGDYTRYSYTNCDACVVLEADGRILVLNGVDEESTRRIYEELREKQ